MSKLATKLSQNVAKTKIKRQITNPAISKTQRRRVPSPKVSALQVLPGQCYCSPPLVSQSLDICRIEVIILDFLDRHKSCKTLST